MSNTESKEVHLDKLADAVIERLHNEPDGFYCGLGPKWPFGFKGQYSIAKNVCEIVGIDLESTEDGMDFGSDAQIEYGLYLLESIPDHIRKRWKEFRAGKVEHVGHPSKIET